MIHHTLYICQIVEHLSWTKLYPNKLLAVIHLLKAEELNFDIQSDRCKVMTLSNGRVHPTDGFVLVATATDGTEELIFDVYDLVKYIDAHGLRQL